MKLYIPPQDLFRYWRLTRRRFEGAGTVLPLRWCAFEGAWPRPNPNGVFFSACDRRYFELYGENYITSVAQSGGRQSVHLHIYDGDDSHVAAAMHAGCMQGVPVSITRDSRSDAALNSEFLFAAGRFVILPTLLETAASPVICTDIDVLVRGSFDAAIAALAGSDVSLHLRPESSLPWRKVLASTVIGMPTQGAATYFNAVAVVLAELLGRPLNHHVDQMILYLGYREARARRAPLVRFAPMSKDLIDWDFDEQSLVWNAKGPERKPAYWRAARAMRAAGACRLEPSWSIEE